MNSHKVLIGEPEGKSKLGGEDKIETAAERLGCGFMNWMYVDQNCRPVADYFEQSGAQSGAQNL
jgi:hypothetical protein